MTLESKQTKEWDFGSIKKTGSVWWQNVVVKGTDIIICKVCGRTQQEAIDLAWVSIIDIHNNLL